MKVRLLTVCFVLCGFSSLVWADLNDGLVAYYPFNGNAQDESGRGLHGLLNGPTPTTDQHGEAGAALEFDGIDDYITIGKSFPDLEEMTFAFWVYTQEDTSGNVSHDSAIICDGDTAAANDTQIVINRNGEVYLTADKAGKRLRTSFTLDGNFDETWRHVVWIMTGEYSDIYVDGKLAKRLLVGGSNVGNHDFYIGTVHRGFNGYWKGKLSSLHLYDREISQQEIIALYEMGGGEVIIDPDASTSLSPNSKPISITTIAGREASGYSGDGGPALLATLKGPIDLAVDSDGVVYIADKGNHCIRRVGSDGVISTVVDSIDYLNSIGVAPLAGGGLPANTLYLFDENKINFVRSDGTVGQPGNWGWGYLAFDAYGSIFMTDRNRVKFSSLDNVRNTTTIASGLSTQTPRIWINRESELFIVDTQALRIVKVDLHGNETTIAGTGSSVFQEGAQATQTGLLHPFAVTGDDLGRIFVLDASYRSETYVVRQVDTAGIITTIAGGGNSKDDNIDPLTARLAYQSYGSSPSQDDKQPYEANLIFYDNSLLLIDGNRIRKLSFGEGMSRVSLLHVDDNAWSDPGPNDFTLSDPEEDGTVAHPFDSIQEAIDVAENGDKVVVRSGTYYETIDFLGKNIHVTGFDPNVELQRGQSCPIIDADYQGTAVTFSSGEDPNAQLSGFTITRGSGLYAGGILCLGSHPRISNCLIVGNRVGSEFGGGAVYAHNSQASFDTCTISGNYGGQAGAGFYSDESENTITNSILWGNLPAEIWYPMFGETSTPPVFRYCALPLEAYWAGNIIDNPRFALPGYWTKASNPEVPIDMSEIGAIWIDGDYRLTKESPCVDAGDPESTFDANQLDLNGQPRLVNDRVDMGSCEYNATELSLVATYNHISIALTQDANAVNPETTFIGHACLLLDVFFTSKLLAQAVGVSDAGGTWTVTLVPDTIAPAMGVEVELTIRGTDVDVRRLKTVLDDIVLAEIELRGVFIL